MTYRIVGHSQDVIRVRRTIAQVAPSDIDVLIIGEEGTGRQYAAKCLHANSQRASGPFVIVDLTSLRPEEHETSLFGSSGSPGALVAAHQGTLVIVEPSSLRLPLQSALLHVLRRRGLVDHFRKIAVDARIVAITSRNVDYVTALGDFDRDLFARLSLVTIEVAPLRARSYDILELAHEFARESTEGQPPRISAVASRALLRYGWPGNVRELRDVVSSICSEAPDIIDIAQLPQHVVNSRDKADTPSPPSEGLPTLDEMGRSYVREVLNAVEGNKSRAARVLGVDRRTLYRLLQKIADEVPSNHSA